MFDSAKCLGILVSLSILMPGHRCLAEPVAAPVPPDRVSSQVLFERGRALLIQGQFAEACPLLEESHRLAPGIGVLLHLGACLEKSGKIAGAWAAFQEAADRARAEGDSERESVARARVAELRGKLAYLTLQLRRAGSKDQISPGNLPTELVVQRNGQALSTATLGLEIPMDPGQHQFVVRAPGMVDANKDITLTQGEHATLELEFVPTPSAVPTASPKSAEPAKREAQATLAPSPRQPETSSAWPWVVWTSAGIGAAGLLTATVAGFVAYTKMQDARALCAGHPNNDCPAESLRLEDQARLPAGIATAGAVVGVAGLAFAGGYWLVSRSGRTVVTASANPRISLIALETRW
jgi:hypothetical protein